MITVAELMVLASNNDLEALGRLDLPEWGIEVLEALGLPADRSADLGVAITRVDPSCLTEEQRTVGNLLEQLVARVEARRNPAPTARALFTTMLAAVERRRTLPDSGSEIARLSKLIGVSTTSI